MYNFSPFKYEKVDGIAGSYYGKINVLWQRKLADILAEWAIYPKIGSLAGL